MVLSSSGDAAFNSAKIYGLLKNEFGFQKALFPYNPRNNESTLKKVGFNEYGYPTYPNAPCLAMKYYGITKEKGRSDRIPPESSYDKRTMGLRLQKSLQHCKKTRPSGILSIK